MPQTIEVTAYKFQELTDKAKQTAMYKLTPEYEWWDQIYEDAKEEGKDLGFDISHIYFSGFYSQGDGALWTGWVNMIPWLEKNKQGDAHAQIVIALMEDGWVDPSMLIGSRGRDSHSSNMTREHVTAVEPRTESVFGKSMFAGASVDNLIQALPESYIDDIADEALESARDYADDIYKRLRDEYEYLCSEEYIAELCDANEYLFDENGNLL